MKKILLLIVFNTITSFAQITQVEVKKQKELTMGNNPEQALKNLELLEKKYPKDKDVMILRGLYQVRDSDPNGALATFSNAIKENPKFAYAYACRAQVFDQKQLSEKAIADISQAILLNPTDTGYLLARIGLYFRNNNLQLALNDNKTIRKLKPNEIANYYDAADFTKKIDVNADGDVFFTEAYANKNIPKHLTNLYFGKFLIANGRFDQAAKLYKETLITNEKNFDDDDFSNASIAFYKTKDVDAAISTMKKAILIKSNNVNYYVNLCSFYLDKKDFQNIKTTAESALKINSEHPMANMFMAIGLKNTGDETKALEFETKAKRLDAE